MVIPGIGARAAKNGCNEVRSRRALITTMPNWNRYFGRPRESYQTSSLE